MASHHEFTQTQAVSLEQLRLCRLVHPNAASDFGMSVAALNELVELGYAELVQEGGYPEPDEDFRYRPVRGTPSAKVRDMRVGQRFAIGRTVHEVTSMSWRKIHTRELSFGATVTFRSPDKHDPFRRSWDQHVTPIAAR